MSTVPERLGPETSGQVNAAPQGSELEEGLLRYVRRAQLDALRAVRIGIAGLGGIGSNVAMLLVRSGATQLLLADCDVVEKSNLNRQCYVPADLGLPKTEALVRHLKTLEPALVAQMSARRITRDSVQELLAQADIWVEALDGAEDKKMLVEACLFQGKFCIACSGMGGYGGPALQVRHLGSRLTVVGDCTRDVADFAPLAPRVTACAALMADALLAHVWQGLERGADN